MAEYSIYRDIAERSGGDVYIGVVGPVRTGKSTFIKKFMDLLVIPNIPNTYTADRTRDELPQSAAGRTIMTTEPKFIPNEAVTVNLGDNANLKVRMIDCVGYIVDGSLGYIEEDMPRMVKTPWSDDAIPFSEAAEIGTKKVICEHSTIGLVVTTDGSICEIDRQDYIPAETRVINELKELNKPFIIILNTVNPNSQDAIKLKKELEQQHGVPVACVNCEEIDAKDINDIIEKVLFEFPVSEIKIKIPGWMQTLDKKHWLCESVYSGVLDGITSVNKINDVRCFADTICGCEYVDKSYIEGMDLGKGMVDLRLVPEENLFYKVLGEITGLEISDEKKLIDVISDMAKMKKEYDKISYALHEVNETGYGIVSPSPDEMTLQEPQIVKQGGRFGVKLKASAPSLHLIRADIETVVNPIVGTEKQSEELMQYLTSEIENDPSKIWETNLFGKSLYDLVNDGLHTKLSKMPEESRMKLKDTLTRIINEGSGGLICIIL